MDKDNYVNIHSNLISPYYKIINGNIDINNYKENKNNQIKILDIGCSIGKNSFVHLNSIIEYIRNDNGIDNDIEVIYCDKTGNDFTTLNIEIDKNSKKKKWDNIYSYSMCKSFLIQILPDQSCDIIYSYFTLHWSEEGRDQFIKNKNSFVRSKYENCSNEYNEFCYNRLNLILANRYQELKINGIFIFNLMLSENKEMSQMIEEKYGNIKNIFRQMANENILSHDEVDDLCYPVVSYRKIDLEKILLKYENDRKFKIIYSKETKGIWSEPKDDPNIYLNNFIGYCGPHIKKSLKGNDTRKLKVMDNFKERFIKEFYKCPNNFKHPYMILFLILKKIK